MSAKLRIERTPEAALRGGRSAGLAVGRRGDVYEQQADRLAARVMGRPEPGVESSESMPDRGGIAPSLVNDVLHAPGQPLDPATRAFMEPRFGHDFSRVRVHTDGPAAESARAVDARAYTVGRSVVFGAGQYAPQSARGAQLLAHELAHTVQQSAGSAPALLQRQPAGPEPSAEQPAPLLVTIEFAGTRVKDFKQVERIAPRIKQYLDSGTDAVDLIGFYDSSDDFKAGGQAGDARRLARQQAEGLRTILTVWFNLPKSRISVSAMDRGLLSGGDQKPGVLVSTLRYAAGSGQLGATTTPSSTADTPAATPATEQAAEQPGWLKKLADDLKVDFGFTEGLTVSSKSHPGISTNIFVTGITQKLFKTPGGLAGQVEVGWGDSAGFQLSYKDWFLHGSLDTDGKWGLTLSFPNDSPIPLLPWVTDIFREGGVAVRGFVEAAAAGPPDLNNLDPLKKQLSPHIDRMKNAVDAAKGLMKAEPGVSFALSAGSGPRPGATPAEKPTGIFLGGSLVVSF